MFFQSCLDVLFSKLHFVLFWGQKEEHFFWCKVENTTYESEILTWISALDVNHLSTSISYCRWRKLFIVISIQNLDGKKWEWDWGCADRLSINVSRTFWYNVIDITSSVQHTLKVHRQWSLATWDPILFFIESVIFMFHVEVLGSVWWYLKWKT